MWCGVVVFHGFRLYLEGSCWWGFDCHVHEAREETIHSPIAYLLWIWRGSTSTVIYCNHAGLVSSLSGFAFSL
ncbi:hypothetical protein Bca4012_046418 [Brassica carinata]